MADEFTPDERAAVIASVVGSQALAGVAVTPGEAGALLDGLADTPLPPIGAGAGVTEADLREAVGWIVDRSPTWDERNMVAVQRFNLAIAELGRLRAENERLVSERADLLTEDEAYWRYYMSPRY